MLVTTDYNKNNQEAGSVLHEYLLVLICLVLPIIFVQVLLVQGAISRHRQALNTTRETMFCRPETYRHYKQACVEQQKTQPTDQTSN